MTRSQRADERMFWILQEIVRGKNNGIVAWDEDVVDAFIEDFPEAKAATREYTMGPSSCPMLNVAARRGKDRDYLTPGSVGNMDARSYNQRTWCRYWTLTPKGRMALSDHHRSQSLTGDEA